MDLSKDLFNTSGIGINTSGLVSGPSFQTFEKEKITNPFFKQPSNNKTININETNRVNKEDSNTDNLIVNRSKELMETKVFLVIHNSLEQNNIRSIINYIKHILKIEKECESSIDTIKDFDNSIFKEDTVYIFDSLNEKLGVKNQDITGTEITSLMMKDIFEKVGGLIFIANNIKEVPKFICTVSQLVFIQKDIEDIQTTLAVSAGIKFKENSIVDIDMFCINKFNLWTKICNFNKK
jgi:hypothetical protein